MVKLLFSCEGRGVLDIHAQLANGAFNLDVTELDLYTSEIAGLLVNE